MEIPLWTPITRECYWRLLAVFPESHYLSSMAVSHGIECDILRIYGSFEVYFSDNSAVVMGDLLFESNGSVVRFVTRVWTVGHLLFLIRCKVMQLHRDTLRLVQHHGGHRIVYIYIYIYISAMFLIAVLLDLGIRLFLLSAAEADVQGTASRMLLVSCPRGKYHNVDMVWMRSAAVRGFNFRASGVP